MRPDRVNSAHSRLKLSRIWLGRAALALIIVLLSLILGFAYWYELPVFFALKIFILIFWSLFCLAILCGTFFGYRTPALITLFLIFTLSLAWWSTILPSNNRPWADDVARTVTGTVTDNKATLLNVRDFSWRSDTDYTQHWETRSYDLNQLASVDLFLSSWSNPAIAHTLIGFGFKDGEFIDFSFEIRKTKSQEFSEIAGFFKQYELALIAADERDIIKVRTDIRKEDVSIYRIKLTPPEIKSLFLAYIAQGNALAKKPEFYNTITKNCTTVVFDMMRQIIPTLKPSYTVIFSGYLPRYIYKLGGFEDDLSLNDIIARGQITLRAQQAGDSPDFSKLIRGNSG